MHTFDIIGAKNTSQSRGPHRQKYPFVSLGRAHVSNESDSDSLEANNSKSKEFYANDSSDDEVGFYTIRVVLKAKVPPYRPILLKEKIKSRFCQTRNLHRGWIKFGLDNISSWERVFS